MKVTVELERKFVPLMVKVCADAPAATDTGERELIAGTALPTVKLAGDEVPPPGAGFVTATG